MVEKVLDKVFDNYRERYIKILDVLYPAKGSTGFTERNQSVNYSKAMEELYPSTVTWFEFQFGDENNKHIDAVIINPELQTIFIIEAKRFSLVKKKTKSIGDDILRIEVFAKEFIERMPNFAGYSLQGVILADVWTEAERKIKIKEAFENKNFLKTCLSSGEQKLADEEVHYNVTGFENTPHECVNKNYYLLGMTWDLSGN